MAIDKVTLEKAQRAFIGARIQLMSTRPFYAHLVMKLPLEWRDEVAGGLSCTDGRSIFIQPEAFLSLGRKERQTVLVHEALHCVAGHLWRRGGRDAFRWNVAGDVYIANIQEAEGFTMLEVAEQGMQKAGIIHSDYRELPTEGIYNKLPASCQSQPQSGSGKGKGSKGQGKGQPKHWNGEGGCFHEAAVRAEDAGQTEAMWKQAVIEAGQLAGTGEGAWQELVKAAMPKPPFHLRLFEYLSRGLGGDSTFDSFNRRYVWQGLYLPCETRVVMGRVVAAVDTSGSMSSAALAEVLGYMRAFREQHPCVLDLIQCDYDVAEGGAGHRTYEEYEPLPATFEITGRGGTAFDPPFKMLREKRIEPKVLIYLTDGYGSVEHEKAPAYPVLWVVVGENRQFKPPFGEVVYGAE